MPYEMSVHAQDPSIGRVGVVLEALGDASERAGTYAHVDIAVAYASSEGVRLMDERLSSGTWSAASKRFLVSIDFGFTEPEALERLRSLNNAEVRIPNGRSVLESQSLRPPSAFHAKSFAFRAEESHNLSALIVGSANLTASALSTGAEVVTKQLWMSTPPSVELKSLELANPLLEWFEDAWANADPLSDVLDDYRSHYDALPKSQQLPEEATPATRHYLASPNDHVISGTLPVQLATAKSLWVDGSSIIRNRGADPGNQLNTTRGTRIFFGIGSEHRPKNTTLGTVNIRVVGYPYIARSVRFGHNGMDVISLPIPEDNGVDTYQGMFLVFSRDRVSNTGLGQFSLTVTDVAGLASLKEMAANSVELSMHGGRRYGLLF